MDPPELLGLQFERWPQDDEELWQFMATVLEVRIPRVRVCPHHCAPFDAVADAFFARSNTAVWKGSRTLAGKSYALAALGLSEVICLQCDVTILGGSGQQSKNVHDYMARGWDREWMPSHLIASQNQYETALVTGNTARALLASSRSVRGPHPPRLRMDEVDEMALWICQSALGQPLTRDIVDPLTLESREVQSQGVLSSTHQYPDGTMSYVLKQAAEKGWPIFEWCYKESMGTEEEPGWLTAERVEDVRGRMSQAMWDTEVELQEPTAEGRAIQVEAVDAMWNVAQGRYSGKEGEEIILEDRIPGAVYCTGADWARDVDWTIISTYRLPEEHEEQSWILAAWLRLGRRPWPQMVGRLNERLARYRGKCIHDATGLGAVIDDYLEVPPETTVEGLWLAGKLRAEVFSSYVTRIEHGGFLGPRVEYAHSEHKYVANRDLYGTGGHPPDSVVAGALAWRARLLAVSKVGLVRAIPRKAPRGKWKERPFVDPRGAAVEEEKKAVEG